MPFKTGVGTADSKQCVAKYTGLIVSMPFKTGVGTAVIEGGGIDPDVYQVSMPFKTGVGTADHNREQAMSVENLFQCPLRRAWVLRVKLPCEPTPQSKKCFNAL